MGHQSFYQEAIDGHRQAIREEYKHMWGTVRRGMENIRKHKLLIKQAKLARRLDSLSHYSLSIPVTQISSLDKIKVRYERS